MDFKVLHLFSFKYCAKYDSEIHPVTEEQSFFDAIDTTQSLERYNANIYKISNITKLMVDDS